MAFVSLCKDSIKLRKSTAVGANIAASEVVAVCRRIAGVFFTLQRVYKTSDYIGTLPCAVSKGS